VHISELSEKIAELVGLRDSLQELMHSCHGDERPDCPIIRELESGSGRSCS
jgi:MerR family copper efflux transcriptional regulator